MKFKLLLNQIEDAKQFVELARLVDGDVNVAHNHYVVDGKSILGIMSLTLSEPVEVTVISDDKEAAGRFALSCKMWMI